MKKLLLIFMVVLLVFVSAVSFGQEIGQLYEHTTKHFVILSYEPISKRQAKTFDNIMESVMKFWELDCSSKVGLIIFPTRSFMNTYVNVDTGRTTDYRGVYLPTDNMIYLSTEDMTMPIIVHEFTHVLLTNELQINNVKIQEILAGYAEYQFMKERKK